MSTSPKPDGYHHGDLRRALIDSGLALLAEQGLEPLSLRAVARRVGVSAMAPYRHFADRDALLAALAEHGYRLLGEAMGRAMAANPPDRMRALGEAYVRFALAQPPLFRLMFGPVAPLGRRYEGLNRAGEAAFAALQQEVAAAGGARNPMAAWCLVHGLATLLLEGWTGVSPDDPAAVDALIAAVLA